MTFGEQLKAARERIGLTQAEAARILDAAKSTVEKWEAGTKTPKPITQEGALARLARLKPKRAKS